jgi:hypothetical protein
MKVQAFAGNVLAQGSGSAPNAIRAVQTYQTYEAYQNGEGLLTEILKAGVYTAAPLVVGRDAFIVPSGHPNQTEHVSPISGKASQVNNPEP